MMRLCILLSTLSLLQSAVAEWQYDAQPFRVGTMRMICRSDQPSIDLFDRWRQAEVIHALAAADNIRELCASRMWGGKPQNAGGTCEFSRDGTLAFDRTIESMDEGMTMYNDLRFMMYCRTKCLCVNRGPTTEAPAVHHLLPTLKWLFDPTNPHPMRVLPGNYATVPFSRFVTIIKIHRAARRRDPTNPVSAILVKTALITGEQQNDLVCNGELPWWDFYNKEDMTSLYSLCASTFLGGLRTTNNGGRCGHTDLGTWDVVFDEELQSSEYNDAISGYCFVHCYCESGEFKKPGRRVPWYSMAGSTISFEKEENSMLVTNPLDGTVEVRSVFEGVRRNPFRVLRWDQFQDASSAASDAAAVVVSKRRQRQRQRQRQQQQKPRVCRTAGSCHGPQDCGGILGCACIVDSSKALFPSSQDAGLPQGQCGWTAAAGALARASSSFETYGLVGRGVLEDPRCACNGTFISQGCCGSVDGLVWDDPDG